MSAMESSKKYGAAEAPDWDSFHLQNFLPKQTSSLLHPRSGSSVIPVHIYYSSCGKSQLDSQSKLATPKRENRKILH
jgi:hypothetical protein